MDGAVQGNPERSNYIEEMKRQHAIAAHERSYQSLTDARKAAIDAATTAIRSLILVNGGAVVALLAFTGAIETSENGGTVSLDALAAPIWWFAIGVGLSATAAMWAYIVNVLDSDILASVRHVWQHPYIEEKEISKSLRIARAFFMWSGLCLALSSLFAFFSGVYTVTNAISGLGI
jgi:hypothetical protein